VLFCHEIQAPAGFAGVYFFERSMHMQPMNDKSYMQLAIQMAAIAQGQTSINPVVGCVLVRDGEVVGMGAHLRRGEAHAEVQALRMAGNRANGSTAYVTLEPCCHYGKTPPCADQLIAAGVKRVVVAATDPHHHVAGKGIEVLRASDIEVEVGLCADEAEKLNVAFRHYIQTRTPYVTYKAATTLDGKTATASGESKWITGEAARELVHTMRHQNEAIMVGIGTVLADNPSLTTRLSVPARNPIRIIVDSQLRIPFDAKVVTDGEAQTWVVTTEHASKEKEWALMEHDVRVIRCGEGEQVDLALMMKRLGELEVPSILLEGGGRLAGAMLEQGLIHALAWFVAPKLIGGGQAPVGLNWPGVTAMSEAHMLSDMQSVSVGDDILITARLTERK
jgi:diaminohydroxyphosphoribosylaminopyrimidine deaminase/5-amino-6-(5-phosphoribosylamino)uracil reductase